MLKSTKKLFATFYFILVGTVIFAQNYPSVTLTNKEMEVMIFLPDSSASYYQASRFDWGSMVAQVSYNKHTYMQEWKNYIGRGPEGVHNPITPNTGTGLAEEFIAALGFDEAAVNEPFVKIGVGILQKTDTSKYSFATVYPIIDKGKRSLQKSANKLSFTHELNSTIGYSYILNRTYLLKGNKLIVQHTLTNTGKKKIVTETYSHNFMQFDFGAFGPDFSLEFLKSTIDVTNQKWVSGDRVKFEKSSLDLVQDFKDFSPTFGQINVHTKKGDCRLINKKTGMSATIELDKEVSTFVAWMWQKSFCAEPRHTINLEPGKSVKWKYIYTFQCR